MITAHKVDFNPISRYKQSMKKRSRIKSLIGKRFVRLVVLSHSVGVNKNGSKYAISKCICDCGKVKKIRSNALQSKLTQSCGCLNLDNYRKKHPRKTHGDSKTRLYSIWCHMMARGSGREAPKYYYDKGVRVYKKWHDFLSFKDWALNNGYNDELEIDRVKNSKGYSPNNCKWATRDEQMRNTSATHFLSFKGKTMCITDWAKEIGVWPQTVYWRINRGLPMEKVLSSKKNKPYGLLAKKGENKI